MFKNFLLFKKGKIKSATISPNLFGIIHKIEYENIYIYIWKELSENKKHGEKILF